MTQNGTTADNRILTADGSGGIVSESALTFDGTTLTETQSAYMLALGEQFSLRTGGAIGNGRQVLFMDESHYTTDNSTTISTANNFHYYERGEVRVEWESDNLMQFYLESGVGFDCWYGLQGNSSHHWSFGQDASDSGNLVFCTDFGLNAANRVLKLRKSGAIEFNRDVDNNATGYLQTAVGTTAQRPGTPSDGHVRVNTTTGNYEGYRDSVWRNLESSGTGDFSDGGEVGGADRTLGNTDNFDLGFLTNNANRIHIANDGMIGINTTAPANQLEIESSSFQILRLERTTVGGGSFMIFENGDDYWSQVGLQNDEIFSIYNPASGAAGTKRSINVTTGGDVGINKTIPTAGSTLHIEAKAGSREKILKGTVDDSGNDAFYVGNLTALAATFVPTFAGYIDSRDDRGSFAIIGFVSSANDASDSSEEGIVTINAYRTTNAGDPLVGTYSQIQNRRVYSMRSNDEFYQTIDHNGRYWIGHASAYDVADDQLHIETESTDGWAVLKLEQKDTDQEFIDLTGTSAANAANSLTSWTAGNTIQGFFRIEVNGTDRWVPFYDAPTS